MKFAVQIIRLVERFFIVKVGSVNLMNMGGRNMGHVTLRMNN
jgi:ribosomal protein L23